MRFRLTTLVMLLSALACAQEFRALISGQVTDSSGAIIPGATVKATNLDTNVTVTTTTASDGRYVLAQVPAGPYTRVCEATRSNKPHRQRIEPAQRHPAPLT